MNALPSTRASTDPPALGLSEGALLAVGLATVVIGGLVGATLLTLFVVPAVYSLVARGGRRRPGHAATPGEDEGPAAERWRDLVTAGAAPASGEAVAGAGDRHGRQIAGRSGATVATTWDIAASASRSRRSKNTSAAR